MIILQEKILGVVNTVYKYDGVKELCPLDGIVLLMGITQNKLQTFQNKHVLSQNITNVVQTC